MHIIRVFHSNLLSIVTSRSHTRLLRISWDIRPLSSWIVCTNSLYTFCGSQPCFEKVNSYGQRRCSSGPDSDVEFNGSNCLFVCLFVCLKRFSTVVTVGKGNPIAAVGSSCFNCGFSRGEYILLLPVYKCVSFSMVQIERFSTVVTVGKGNPIAAVGSNCFNYGFSRWEYILF